LIASSQLSLSATLRQNSAEQKRSDAEHIFFFSKLLEINRLCDNISKENYPLHDSGNRIQKTLHQSAFLRGGRGGGVGDLKGFLRGGEGDLLIPGAGARGVSVFFLPRPFSLNAWIYAKILFCTEIIQGRYPLCLKVQKIENFFGFDFEICTISLLVMSKY
jgi:hypothetical protein